MVSDGSVLVNRLMILLLFLKVLHVCDDDLESVIVPAFILDKVTEFTESLKSDVKGVKDSDHINNNSVDDISLASLSQDPRSEVDTSKYESKPVVEYMNEANNNNSDNPHDDVEVKEEKEEPATEPELSTICPQCGKVYASHKKMTDQLHHYYYEINILLLELESKSC